MRLRRLFTRRTLSRIGIGTVLMAASLYVAYHFARQEIKEFVWRQSRGTRYEPDVIRWALTDSSDPLDRNLATSEVKAGDPVEPFIAKYGSFTVVEVGRYRVLNLPVPHGLIAFEGTTVVAKDGRLASASSWCCSWNIDFFDTLTAAEWAEVNAGYTAEREKQLAARMAAEFAVAGFGASQYWGPPPPPSADEGED